MPGTVLHSRIFPAWKLWMLVLALAVLRPVPALAQGSTDVQAYLLSVKRLYEDLENESALKQIASAKKLPRTKNEDVTLSLYEGVIQADLSHWEKSAAAFKAALIQHPEAQLPVKVSPKVQQHFEKVRQQVKQELMARAKPPTPPPGPTPAPARPPASPPKQEAAATQAGPMPKRPELTPDQPPSPTVLQEPPSVMARSSTRPRILIPAIASGALLAAGGTSWALSRRELSRLNRDDPSLATRQDAQSAASRGRTLQSVGVGLLGAGIVGLGLTAGWYALGGGSSRLSLQVGTSGTSAFVQGRWP
jgi:hypothetical protein